jgi:hypothetical protein
MQPGSFVVNVVAHASQSALTPALAEMRWLNGWSAAAIFEGDFSNLTLSYADKGIGGGIPRKPLNSVVDAQLTLAFQRISALRQRQPSAMLGILMSALAPIADISLGGAYVRFVPEADFRSPGDNLLFRKACPAKSLVITINAWVSGNCAFDHMQSYFRR